MPQEYNIPTLKGLDPKSHDYNERIDEGLRTLDMVWKAIRLEYDKVVGSVDMVSFFRERGVKVVQDSQEIESAHRRVDNKLDSFLETKVKLEDPDDEQLLLAQRVNQEYQEHLRPMFEPLRDLEAEANLAYANFREAAGDLTESKPLNKINPKYQKAQFYLIREGRVYSADLIDGSLHVPYSGGELFSEEDVTPDMFLDDDFLESFIQKSKDNQTNYYLLTSPLVEFTARDIFSMAANDVLLQGKKSAVEKMAENIKEKGKGLLRRITSR